MHEILHVTYQQFLDHGKETIARTQAFLGADPCAPDIPSARAKSTFQRPAADTPICKIVANWNELCLALGNCKKLGLPEFELDYIDAECHCEHVGCTTLNDVLNYSHPHLSSIPPVWDAW